MYCPKLTQTRDYMSCTVYSVGVHVQHVHVGVHVQHVHVGVHVQHVHVGVHVQHVYVGVHDLTQTNHKLFLYVTLSC